MLSLVQAQASQAGHRAADGVTAPAIARRIAVIADDSMRGRDTPSPELEKVASWIAAEFRSAGLSPAGERGTFFQRYPLVRTELDTSQTYLAVSRDGVETARLRAAGGLEILQLGAPLAPGDFTGPALPDRGRASRSARGAWLVQRAGPGPDAAYAARERAYTLGAVGIVLVAEREELNRDAAAGSEPSAWRVDASAPRPPFRYPVVVEIESATAQALGIGPVPGLTLTLHLAQRIAARTTAPNVVGLLEGSDPTLARQFVLFGAHMDHIGVASPLNPACQASGGDSICNGADDDASGVVAVIELAGAFARLPHRPRRSLVFVAVSGEEKGLWGSGYFTAHPPIPLDSIVADLNMDMVGRNWSDTIAVIGKEHSSLGTTVDSVASAHPELHMTPVPDRWPAENFYTRSDHYNFARRGVPILFFFNGIHADYHRVSDEVSKINAEKESRVVKLVFYTGLALAQATTRPRWNPASYRRVVESAN